MRKTTIFAAGLLFVSLVFAQHPNRKRIDSLKNLLDVAHGIDRINCLNALSEEYWWPPRVFPDSISMWAIEANQEASKIDYRYGVGASTMHLGVAEIYRRNFVTAENYLRQAFSIFENLQSVSGLAWIHLWLGQALYSENNFNEAISHDLIAISFFEETKDWEGVGKAGAWLGFLYAARGDYDSSFYYCSKSLMIRQNMHDDVCVAAALTNMGHLYRVVGDFTDALDYYRQGLQYARVHNINLHNENWNYLDEPMAVVYQLMNQQDSSQYYLQVALQIDPGNQMTRVSLGESFMAKMKYDSALVIFLEPIEHFRRENDRWDLMHVLLDAAKAYEGLKDETTALRYAREGFSIAQEANVRQYMMQGWLLLSTIYSHLGRDDSAYFFMQRYATLKDSVMTSQFMFRLSNYKEQIAFKKQMDELASLDRNNKMQEEQLKRAAQVKWSLIISLLVVVLSGFMAYRNLSLKRKNEKLESQKKQSELQLRASELEMQALRAQMNPHFIFNSLSSINRFILKNETEAASDYLTKFSRLIRMVLTNSSKPFISIEDELDMVRLYLDMERLRFKDSFDYSIRFTNSIDVANVFVPPLLLQPFVENAIWHGLMHKKGQGHLEIALSIDNKILTCAITDNGIGRARAALLKTKSAEKQKSMGLKITTERLSLLNQHEDEKTFFRMEDILDDAGNDAGTRIILKMNYKGLTEISTNDVIKTS